MPSEYLKSKFGSPFLLPDSPFAKEGNKVDLQTACSWPGPLLTPGLQLRDNLRTGSCIREQGSTAEHLHSDRVTLQVLLRHLGDEEGSASPGRSQQGSLDG